MFHYPLRPELSFVKRIIAEAATPSASSTARCMRTTRVSTTISDSPQFRSHDNWGPEVIPDELRFRVGRPPKPQLRRREWGMVPKKLHRRQGAAMVVAPVLGPVVPNEMTPRVAPAPELRLGDAVAACCRRFELAPGQPPTAGGVNSACSRRAPQRRSPVLRRRGTRASDPDHRIDPEANARSAYWHCFRAGREGGPDLRVPGRTVRSSVARAQVRREQGAVGSMRTCSRRSERLPNRAAAVRAGDNAAVAMKSVVVDATALRLGRRPPAAAAAWSQTIVYELHVRGFTRHPSSGVAGGSARNLCRARSPSCPYLQRLGITARRADAGVSVRSRSGLLRRRPRQLLGLLRPSRSSAPHQAYSARRDPLGPVDEFRDMVKALHRAGIEVILDVVFNHTAEGDHRGPTLCFRGLRERRYYHARCRTVRGTPTYSSGRQYAQRQSPDRPPA